MAELQAIRRRLASLLHWIADENGSQDRFARGAAKAAPDRCGVFNSGKVQEGLHMLVLSRKIGEKVVIGDGIVVVVKRIHGQRVTFGIEAPESVRIVRGELPRFEDTGEVVPRAGAERNQLWPVHPR